MVFFGQEEQAVCARACVCRCVKKVCHLFAASFRARPPRKGNLLGWCPSQLRSCVAWFTCGCCGPFRLACLVLTKSHPAEGNHQPLTVYQRKETVRNSRHR